MNNHIIFQNKNNVAVITLNRPFVHNAFNAEMISELTSAFDAVAKDPSVSVVLLQSVGKSFCAGADLQWMKSTKDFTPSENKEDAEKLSNMLNALYNISQPTIAKVSGPAYGGGVGLIAACDYAIASERAVFCLSEVKLGLAPAVIAPYLTETVGINIAKAWALTAKKVTALEAKNAGLVFEVTPEYQLEKTITELVASVAAHGPNALKQTKQLFRKLTPQSQVDVKEYCINLIAELRSSDEGQEGLHAFFEKRAPNWPS